MALRLLICTLISDLKNRGKFQNPRKKSGSFFPGGGLEKKSGFQEPDFLLGQNPTKYQLPTSKSLLKC